MQPNYTNNKSSGFYASNNKQLEQQQQKSPHTEVMCLYSEHVNTSLHF